MKKDIKNDQEAIRHGERPSVDVPNDRNNAIDAEPNAGEDVEVDRTLAGLLRVIGWHSNTDRELTEAEADLILEVAASEPVSDEQRRRLLDGVLRRRFGTTSVSASETGAEAGAEDELARGDFQRTDDAAIRRGRGHMANRLSPAEPEGPSQTGDAVEKAQGPPLPTAKSLVAQLKDQSGLRLDGIAKGLGVEVGFLVDISEHGPLVPGGARREIARRAMNAWNVPTSVTLAAFDARAEVAMQKAASRSGAFQATSTTYEDIVRRSKLTDDEKRLWLSLI